MSEQDIKLYRFTRRNFLRGVGIAASLILCSCSNQNPSNFNPTTTTEEGIPTITAATEDINQSTKRKETQVAKQENGLVKFENNLSQLVEGIVKIYNSYPDKFKLTEHTNAKTNRTDRYYTGQLELPFYTENGGSSVKVEFVLHIFQDPQEKEEVGYLSIRFDQNTSAFVFVVPSKEQKKYLGLVTVADKQNTSFPLNRGEIHGVLVNPWGKENSLTIFPERNPKNWRIVLGPNEILEKTVEEQQIYSKYNTYPETQGE